MSFDRVKAINEVKRALRGADTRDTRFVLQCVIDEHAQTHKKKMCVLPTCGYNKKGNYDWQDMKRLINASSSMNSPLAMIVEARHCGTTILNSNPHADWSQEQLPNGKYRVSVSMEVSEPVSTHSSIDEVAAQDKSPFKRKRADTPVKQSVFVPAPEKPPQTSFFVPAPEELPEFVGISDFDLSSFICTTPPPELPPITETQVGSPPTLAPIVIAPQTVIVMGSQVHVTCVSRPSPTRPIMVKRLDMRNLL